jgi:hypothetical protein
MPGRLQVARKDRELNLGLSQYFTDKKRFMHEINLTLLAVNTIRGRK